MYEVVMYEVHYEAEGHQQEGEDAEQVRAMLRDQEKGCHTHEGDEDDPEGKASP
jgi:hypothetical protein